MPLSDRQRRRPRGRDRKEDGERNALCPFLSYALLLPSAKFSHRDAVFLAELLGCPAYVVEAAFVDDLGDTVVTVEKRVGDKAKAKIVDKFRNGQPRVLFQRSCHVLPTAVGEGKHTGGAACKIAVFLHLLTEIGEPHGHIRVFVGGKVGKAFGDQAEQENAQLQNCLITLSATV